MTYTFKLSRRLARLRAPLWAAAFLTVVGCGSSDTFAPGSSDAPGDAPSTNNPALATSFAGGIPIGMFAQPTELFGTRYNGAMRNISPDMLLDELAAIKSRGGRIVLMMAGSQPNYLNADGTFSLSKWKERIDRYRGIDFSSYVKDGTIIAHYLMDEPYDPANYGGEPVPGATLDEMARYSKSIWPSLVTVVRSEPYLIKWSGTYQYLDAAWAQYAGAQGRSLRLPQQERGRGQADGPRSGRRAQPDDGRQSEQHRHVRQRGRILRDRAAQQSLSLCLHQLAV